MDTDETYTCALSGKTAPDNEIVHDAEEDDELGELPVGWIKVTVERRGVNPAWLEIQKRKARLTAVQQQQVATQLPAEMPEAEKAEVMLDLAAAVAAQFHALESETEKYLVAVGEAYVMPPEADAQVAAAWKGIIETLGLGAGASK
jgi:hypothetical protein